MKCSRHTSSRTRRKQRVVATSCMSGSTTRAAGERSGPPFSSSSRHQTELGRWCSGYLLQVAYLSNPRLIDFQMLRQLLTRPLSFGIAHIYTN